MADITFLMNADPPGDPNQFYTLAKQFFTKPGAVVVEAQPPGQTLAGVIKELTTRGVAQDTINLVCHASGFASMQAPLNGLLQLVGRRTTSADDLQNALATKSPLPPGPNVITPKTRIVIFGCDVGRSERFLRLLSGLFGNPMEVLGPRRVGVFRHNGATVEYRQAQTWSLARKPPLVLGNLADPTGGWANYRAKFVADANLKFGRIVPSEEPIGPDRLKAMLTTAASNATKTLGLTFFLEEGVDILPDGTQTAAEAAATLTPIANGDPVTATPKTALQLDDTTVVTTLTSSDTYQADATGKRFAITVALLGQVIDSAVLIAEGTDYRRVTTSPGLAPALGPKPVGSGAGSGTGTGSGSGASNERFQQLVEQLLADGAAQADLDQLVADLPQGDATLGLVTDFPDDAGDPDDPNGLLLPTRLEIA